MIFTIARKELSMLFLSPLAWAVLILIQLIFTWTFLGRLDAFLEIQPQLVQIANPPGITEIIVTPVFSMAAIVLLIVTPMLTMRLFAEERQNHTLPLLISAPISMVDIVMGKFFSLMFFFFIVMILIIVLSISLLAGGTLDFGLLASSALGLYLLVACFVALGLYISSLTAQPVIAAVGALGILLGLWVVDMVASDASSFIHHFSLLKQFESFNRGMLDTYSIVYFILFTIVFLVLTVHRLNGERLHG